MFKRKLARILTFLVVRYGLFQAVGIIAVRGCIILYQHNNFSFLFMVVQYEGSHVLLSRRYFTTDCDSTSSSASSALYG